MLRLAVVEDEELIRTMIRLNLEREGYVVETFESGELLVDRLATAGFDAILLDIKLPGVGGEELVSDIRRRRIQTPILMVTSMSDVSTKVSTLARGADDYLAKPFDMNELLARVMALIRRSQGERALPSARRIRVGRCEVNLETRIATTRTGDLSLTETECRLFAFFAANPGRVLSRADILDEVWGMDADPTPRTIDNFVVKFRRMFEEDPENPRHFMTIRASGYLFEP